MSVLNSSNLRHVAFVNPAGLEYKLILKTRRIKNLTGRVELQDSQNVCLDTPLDKHYVDFIFIIWFFGTI